jgi:uncharacterized protein YhaN
MELTHIETELKKFTVTDAGIAELNNQYSHLTISGIDDKAGYAAVREARLVVKGKRVEVDKKRKELTADALEVQRLINTEAKRITALLEPLEAYLAKQEDDYNAEKDRIKKEVEEEKKRKYQDRIDKLYKLNVRFNAVNFVDGHTEGRRISISPIEVETMPSDIFDQLIIQAEISFKEQNEAIAKRKFEEERIEAERKAEAARLEALRQEQLTKESEERRIEGERLEKMRTEQQAERERLEAIAKEQAEKEAAINAEERRIAKLKEESERPAHIIIDESKPVEIDTFKNSLFNPEQMDWICYQIGEWYLEWKNKLVNYDDRTHRLGYAKEQLKEMICRVNQ